MPGHRTVDYLRKVEGHDLKRLDEILEGSKEVDKGPVVARKRVSREEMKGIIDFCDEKDLHYQLESGRHSRKLRVLKGHQSQLGMDPEFYYFVREKGIREKLGDFYHRLRRQQ